MTAIFFAFHLTVSQALGLVVAVMFVVVGDQVCPQHTHATNITNNTCRLWYATVDKLLDFKTVRCQACSVALQHGRCNVSTASLHLIGCLVLLPAISKPALLQCKLPCTEIASANLSSGFM